MRVAILGGGVGGLCAAHELIERGFEVEVYERRDILGGKARSMPLRVSLTEGQMVEQPGEHGFRFFHSGYYLHLYDTMRRIPLGDGSGRRVYDNLVEVPVQYNSGEMYGVDSRAEIPGWLLKLMTTGYDRALREYEDLPFNDFVDGARYSDRIDDAHCAHVAKETPKVLQAVNGSECSTRAMCLLAGRLGDPRERPAKVLNAPTNVAWFDPWRVHLEAAGVRFHTGVCITGLGCENGRIATVYTDRGDITADHYIAALPVEVMRRLLTHELLEADPQLAGLARLRADWMVGFQFHLAERLPELPPGHWGFGNTPFKISGIQQTDFWPEAVRNAQLSAPCEAIVSVIVSEVNTPGILFGKPARLCTAVEMAQELWAQMDMGAKGTPFEAAFKRGRYLGFAVDPDVGLTGDDNAYNESPLFINHCGALWDRPAARTAIPNLFLAADYVRTNTDICTMESAGEAARRAVNGILETTGFTGEPCRIFSLEAMSADTPFFSQMRAFDDLLFLHGLPHPIDLLDRELAGRLVEAAQSFRGFELYRSGSALGELTRVMAEAVRQLGDRLSKTPGLVPQARGFANLVRSLGVGKGRETSTAERLGLRHSIREWAGVDMQPVSTFTGRAPDSLHSYLDTRNPIFAPLLYACERRGSQHRVGFVRALSGWLQVPAETVSHIIELGQCLHNCSLVIDDVLDETEKRRGAPSAWSKFGRAEALGAGYAGVFQILLSTGLYLGDDGLAIVVEEVARAHHSNAIEVHFRETRICPSEAEYLAIVDGKTGCAFRMTARLLVAHASATPSPETADMMEALATTVGRFFQIRDDYLDLTSEDYAQKKGTPCSDFEEGKFSYPVVRCLNARPELLPQFIKVFDKSCPSEADIARLRALVADGLAETLLTLDALHREMLELTEHIARAVEAGTGAYFS